MAIDGLSVGVNWSAMLEGAELHPEDLQDQLQAQMGEAMFEAYLEQANQEL